MKECKLEDFLGDGQRGESSRKREKIVAIYANVSAEEWAQMPLMASVFFEEFEGALILQPIVDRFGKISELFLLTNVDHFELDQGALFIKGYLKGVGICKD